MIDTKKAKSRLLSIAFSGELQTYDSKYETNTEIDSIHASIKKYKKVSDAEKLIDVPKNWVWSRLGYITFNHGQTVPQQPFSYIDVGILDNEHQSLSRTENIIDAKDAPSRARKVIKKGDVIYSTVRPYLHNICVIDKDFSETPIASTAFCVMHANSSVLLNRFLFYWLLTPEFDKFSNGNPSKGMLYPAIGEKALLNAVIPVPSIEEQKAIVRTLDKAFALIDSIAEAQARYTSDVTALKSKVIDAGIRGKLTEQLPEDGTAQDLFAQIQEEKARLAKEGKIKKQKLLPAIKSEEVSFDVPENWMWVRLGDIFDHNTGKALNASDKEGHLLEYITTSNVYWDHFELNGLKSMHFRDDEIEKCTIKKGDLLICEGGDIGRSAIWPYEQEMRIQNHLHRLRPFNTEINVKYYFYMMWSYKNSDLINGRGIGLQGFSSKRVHSLVVPLPPLAEQKRIAERIEEILGAVGE